MLNDLFYRIKIAVLAFRDPGILGFRIPDCELRRLELHGDIAVVKAAWSDDGILIPEIVILTPQQSYEVKTHLHI